MNVQINVGLPIIWLDRFHIPCYYPHTRQSQSNFFKETRVFFCCLHSDGGNEMAYATNITLSFFIFDFPLFWSVDREQCSIFVCHRKKEKSSYSYQSSPIIACSQRHLCIQSVEKQRKYTTHGENRLQWNKCLAF